MTYRETNIVEAVVAKLQEQLADAELRYRKKSEDHAIVSSRLDKLLAKRRDTRLPAALVLTCATGTLLALTINQPVNEIVGWVMGLWTLAAVIFTITRLPT